MSSSSSSSAAAAAMTNYPPMPIPLMANCQKPVSTSIQQQQQQQTVIKPVASTPNVAAAIARSTMKFEHQPSSSSQLSLHEVSFFFIEKHDLHRDDDDEKLIK